MDLTGSFDFREVRIVGPCGNDFELVEIYLEEDAEGNPAGHLILEYE